MILACPYSLLRCHQQRLVTCLTISYVQDEDLFLLATFKKSHSSRKNCITISRQRVLEQCGQNLRFCFRRLRILGLQFSNVPLCSQSVNFFCDMLASCRALEPKTLRVCDCYLAGLNGSDMLRLMKLCGSHLIVLSFMNLTGVSSSLLCDDLLAMANHSGLYVLMIQSIDFHFSVPLCDQYLRIGDATLARLPNTMRKVKLEKCGLITAEGVCEFVERYFGSEPSTSSAHRSTELIFKQCDQLTTASFEREAQRRRIPIEGQETDGEYIMKWVKRRQYHIRKANERRLLSIEIDSYRPIRSGLASPAIVDELSRNSMHSIAMLGRLYPEHIVSLHCDNAICQTSDQSCSEPEKYVETKKLFLTDQASVRMANIVRPTSHMLSTDLITEICPHGFVRLRKFIAS
ncbi:unnamed protein product [Toxocara canis]|uniref:Uncharacterized protein n=1 Tax=Toxocara canis TaxID=6265 RepID=A0A3P7GAR2_TOXCA|nr:unnamed protein product [Toxocara canis]